MAASDWRRCHSKLKLKKPNTTQTPTPNNIPTDYVAGERKFGGNAQAITGRRWLHHTSLLWDFDARNMALLTNPARQPEYRRVSGTAANGWGVRGVKGVCCPERRGGGQTATRATEN